jgi:hypothetical protein
MAKTKKATARVCTGQAQAQASIIAQVPKLPEADIALEFMLLCSHKHP